MLKIGMYSPEIRRYTVQRLFDAIKIFGFEQVQFDFKSVYEESLPREIDSAMAKNIFEISKSHGVEISALNGTFNMAHPDLEVREEYTKRFEQLAKSCNILRCSLITLCTGTRNKENMWRWHDDNETESAWNDLLGTTERLIEIAERYNVTLGVEPEASNVVNSPEKARRLLDEFNSPRLKIVMDPANLFHKNEAYPENALPILEHAFDLLGNDIVAAHGKDIKSGPGIEFTSAGRGIVAFERFLDLLKEYKYDGGIIFHGIHDEAEFPYCVAFAREILGYTNNI